MRAKKLFILTLIVTIIATDSYCQIDSIIMTGVAQMKRNWCWAACSEAIMKKYDNLAKKQCDLGLQNYNQTFVGLTISSCSSCDLCFPNVRPRDKCDKSIDDTQFNTVFGNNQYLCQSTSQYPILFSFPWDTIVKQINNSTPFVMVIQFESRSDTCKSNHAVVGYGIDGDMIIYNNPKNPSNNCTTRSEKIPYRNTSSSTIGKPCRFIYNITPNSTLSQTIARRNASTRIHTSTRNIAKIDSGNVKPVNNLFQGEIRTKISNRKLKELDIMNDFLVIPVKFISHSKILKDSTRALKLDDIIINKKFVDVIYMKPPYTVTTLQKKCNKWYPILITHFQENLDFNTIIDSNKVVLNKKKIDFNSRNKSIDFIVKYPDLGFEFFQSKNLTQSYLIPFADYPYLLNGEEELKEGKVYKESIVTKGLQLETNTQYENTVFLKNPEYKNLIPKNGEK